MSVGWSSDATAVFIRHDRNVVGHNTIGTLSAFEAAGYVGNPGAGSSFCSGTLITSTHFLTAGHCLDPNHDGIPEQVASNLVVGFDVNFPSGGLPANNVANFFINPSWNGSVLFDLAVVQLTLPVVGISPAEILLKDERGQTATIVGYGVQGDGFGNALVGANDRLGARNAIDLSSPFIEMDFDHPNGTTNASGSAVPLNFEGTSCFGDSGSGLFVGSGRIVGVTSVLTANPFGNSCEYGNRGLYAALNNPINANFLRPLRQAGLVTVPEPSSLALFAIGLARLGVMVRRRRREQPHQAE